MSEKAVFRLITLFLKFLGIISSVLSTRLRTRYGEFLGDMMRFLGPGRYKITYDNLKMAFPKENEDWYYETVVKSYRNLGITLAETLAMPYFKESDIRKYIYYENIELLSDVYKRGKGLLLLSGHYGNWELLAYTAGLFTGIPINVIVKPQKNFIADELLNKYRT
ncbi:MAG: Kdo2-lipid lauroyltransferase/acyltransferase, partial [Bacteroidota bacterium]|nr:Kdo2-lipid lauroyltransferase/acyltransferase [Bacteroidota bacterium]